MVPGAGLEPARLAAGDFESPESTNFTTRAVSMKNGLWHIFDAFGSASGAGVVVCQERQFVFKNWIT